MATPEPNPPNALRELREKITNVTAAHENKYDIAIPHCSELDYALLTALTPPAVEKAATEGGTPMTYGETFTIREAEAMGCGQNTSVVVAGFSRTLELKLAAAEKKIDFYSREATRNYDEWLKEGIAAGDARQALAAAVQRAERAENQLATALRDKETGEADTARLHAVTENKWSLSFNDRIGLWTVQAYQQVAGCIAAFNTPRKAIDAAMSAKGDAT